MTIVGRPRDAFTEQRGKQLSTKFAVRPAPRKRPWICKRSPPCLVPPALPPTLLCTIFIQKYWPLPQAGPLQGTFLLSWRPMLSHWSSSLIIPPDGCTVIYTYDLASGACDAYVDWQVGGFIDDGTFDVTNSGAWPKMFYFSKNVEATTYYWNVTLQITG